MKAFVVLRPEPGASRTTQRIEAQGGRAFKSPLFRIERVTWAPPPPQRFDAVMLTSANAVRAAGEKLEVYRALPFYAVGSATAEALHDAGFDQVAIGGSDVEALMTRLAQDGRRWVLHPAGSDHRRAENALVRIEHAVVYRAVAIDGLSEEAKAGLSQAAVVLLHSPRAARHFANLVARYTWSRRRIAIASISLATSMAAGSGWRGAVIAASPDDAALLAAAATLCEGGA